MTRPRGYFVRRATRCRSMARNPPPERRCRAQVAFENQLASAQPRSVVAEFNGEVSLGQLAGRRHVAVLELTY